MIITYHGHACFTLESRGFTVAIDPYDDHVPGFRPLQLAANEVYCSHGHGDHSFVEAVELKQSADPSPFAVTDIAGFHDDAGGSKRGLNTMRVFEAEGLKVAHLGDIGCMPPAEDLEKLKGLDACMVPVGGFYTIDAQQAKELMDILQPRVILPMHYRLGGLGLGPIAELGAFTSLYDHVSDTGSNTLELTKDSPEGVTILQYQ